MYQNNGSSAWPAEAEKSSDVGHASLREHYLNQVQRDFLSLGLG
jgi:hypothetical protein